MATVNIESTLPPAVALEQLSGNLTALLPRLSVRLISTGLDFFLNTGTNCMKVFIKHNLFRFLFTFISSVWYVLAVICIVEILEYVQLEHGNKELVILVLVCLLVKSLDTSTKKGLWGLRLTRRASLLSSTVKSSGLGNWNATIWSKNRHKPFCPSLPNVFHCLQVQLRLSDTEWACPNWAIHWVTGVPSQVRIVLVLHKIYSVGGVMCHCLQIEYSATPFLFGYFRLYILIFLFFFCAAYWAEGLKLGFFLESFFL